MAAASRRGPGVGAESADRGGHVLRRLGPTCKIAHGRDAHTTEASAQSCNWFLLSSFTARGVIGAGDACWDDTGRFGGITYSSKPTSTG